MYACNYETGTGLFAVVCAGKRVSHLLFVAHPYHSAGRELLHADMAMRMLLVIRINKDFRESHHTSFNQQGCEKYAGVSKHRRSPP